MNKFTIILKDRKTNETKEIAYDSLSEDDGYEPISYEDGELIPAGVDYMWTEGNFSCDCNRYDYFYPEDDIDFPCYNKEYKDGNRFELIGIKKIDYKNS